MRKLALGLTVLALLGGELGNGSPALGQQGGTAQTSAALAALRHVRAQLPEGTTKLDPRVLATAPRTGRWAGQRGAEQTQWLARSIGATVGRVEESFRCAERSPSSCRMVDAAAVLAVSDPAISGDTASVAVYTRFRGHSAREPVALSAYEVVLARVGDTWRFVRYASVRRS